MKPPYTSGVKGNILTAYCRPRQHIPFLTDNSSKMRFIHLVAVLAAVLHGFLILSKANAFPIINPISSVKASQTHSKRKRRLSSVVDQMVDHPENFKAEDDDTNDYCDDESIKLPHLIFPGGGLFFYWQAGTVTYLREQGYDMSVLTASGASAGALTATLMTAQVDFIQATELALQMSEEAGVWDRSGGLQGIWGPIIHDWLDELLPENAVELVNHKLSLLVTTIPSFGKDKVSTFRDKQDLIECNMASVHVVSRRAKWDRIWLCYCSKL